MPYREERTSVPGAALWQRSVGSAPDPTRILPDGCLDLVWDGVRLLVAGPDATARLHRSQPGARYVGLRFSGGLGPALLGVPAHELLDRTLRLEEVRPARPARLLIERTAAHPTQELRAWVVEQDAIVEADPLGRRVLGMASIGTPVSAMADRLGLTARALHRRCLPVFGYGPRRLSRVLRLGRALEGARDGAPLAYVAASCGYADQAHLCREVRALAGTTATALLRESGRG